MPDARFSAEDLAALWQASADIRHEAQAIIDRSRQLRAESRELRLRFAANTSSALTRARERVRVADVTPLTTT